MNQHPFELICSTCFTRQCTVTRDTLIHHALFTVCWGWHSPLNWFTPDVIHQSGTARHMDNLQVLTVSRYKNKQMNQSPIALAKVFFVGRVSDRLVSVHMSTFFSHFSPLSCNVTLLRDCNCRKYFPELSTIEKVLPQIRSSLSQETTE